jgi:Acyl-CoA dehydrogenases
MSAEERAEQIQMIRDSATAVVPQSGDLGRIRQLRFKGEGMDSNVWATMVEMGWPGLRLSEDDGGIGLGVAEYTALVEELGRGLVPEPMIEVALVAGLVPEDIRNEILTEGKLILPVGLGFDNSDKLSFASGKLDGKVLHVPCADKADGFLVYCNDQLLLVDAGADGLAMRNYATHDGGHVAELSFSQVSAKLLPKNNSAHIAACRDEAALAKAAYLVGVMQSAFDRTIEYLKVRKQFGREIGTFQVLQHRAVDMKIRLELARATVAQAAAALDDEPDRVQPKLISAACVVANEAAMMVCRESIQLHGGIGYTDEADIGLFLRKVIVLLNRYGSTAFHKRRYMQHHDEAA